MNQGKPQRSSDLRIHNEKYILARIYDSRNTGISQSELVNETGLKAPTVFRIFGNLEEQKLIEVLREKNSEESSRKGRKPLVYTVSKDSLYTAGLEFWVNSISLGIFNFKGDRIFSRIEPLKSGISVQEVIEFVVSIMNEALESLRIDRKKVIGLGVAAPGQVDVVNRRVISYPRIQGMNDIPLADELEKRLGLKVILHNNCSVIALSEYYHGGYDHQGSLFTFLLRAGINGAFVDQRGIYTTSQGTTPESGHIPIDTNGPPCTCGAGGCLESHIQALDKANVKTGRPLFDGLEERLAANDNSAKVVAAKTADYLFLVTKSIMRFFNPRAFLIVANGDLLSQCIAENIKKRWDSESDAFVTVKPMIFSHNYNALVSQLGASELVISDYFNSEEPL
ncbi:MAG: ROK family transcriptional regulator [Treponema sp.]|nr:ROK family transcriptional regulator [Treponema sp.]